MDIISLGFLLFLTVGLTVYYLLPERYQRFWIFVLSCFFLLMHSVFSVLFVVLTAAVIYSIGKALAAAGEAAPARRRRIVALGVCTELAILILVKYSFVAVEAFDALDGVENFRKLPFGEGIFIPLGLSYYTLQAISYVLDVYWKRIPAETSFFNLLNYISFFPQLTQGPISRYGQLSGEINAGHRFEIKNIKFGVQLMLWGFFKTLVVANKAAPFVDAVFHGGTTPYGINVLEGLILFGVQLYCNFSGGIDIIRGAAQCFGVQMMENFRQPFFSRSLSEFWRRWHISLGEWMKDYVFYPLTMSGAMRTLKKKLKTHLPKKTANRLAMALADVIVFYLVGIWHGRGSVYAAWGLYNGLIIASSVVLADRYAAVRKKLRINENARWWQAFLLLRTFLIVTVGWVFDCSASAIYAVRHLLNMLLLHRSILGSSTGLISVVLLTAVVLAVDILHEKGFSIRQYMDKKSYWVQVLFWVVLIQAIACLGRLTSTGGFMYANF